MQFPTIQNPFQTVDPADEARRVDNDYNYYLIQLALFEHQEFYAPQSDSNRKKAIIDEIKRIINTPRQEAEPKVTTPEDPQTAAYQIKEPTAKPMGEPTVFKLDSVTYKKLNAYNIAIKSIQNGKRYMLTSMDDPYKLSNIPVWKNATVSVREDGNFYIITLDVPGVNSDSQRVEKKKAKITIVNET